MPYNGSGTFVRTQNWSNDATNNLPISASKFDNQDNDFATNGFGLCLTRDGQGAPTSNLTWAILLTLTQSADGSGFAVGRTGGSNNPNFQVLLTDASSAVRLNNTLAGGSVALSVNGTAILTAVAGGLSFAGVLTSPNGTALLPSLVFAAGSTSGFYSIGASEIGLSLGATLVYDFAAAVLGLPAANFTGSTIPANGAYLPSANTLGLSSNSTQRATVSAAGVWNFVAPTSAAASGFTFNGIANANAVRINSGATSGQAFGLAVVGGTTSADYAVLVKDQTNTNTFFEVLGTGETFVWEPTTASSIPTGTHQIGYIDTPVNSQGAGYTLALTDRGKLVQQTVGNVTIPANASVAFPVGSTVLVYNATGGNITISITTDTLTWLPNNTNGTRTLANASIATLVKVGSASWRIWGFGLT